MKLLILLAVAVWGEPAQSGNATLRYAQKLASTQKLCPSSELMCPPTTEPPSELKRDGGPLARSIAHKLNFTELDDAIMSITRCDGSQFYPRTRREFITTHMLFRDQKIAAAKGHAPSVGACKSTNAEAVAKLCPQSTKKPELFRTWRADVAAGVAPIKHTNGWPQLKDEQYCKVIIGRKTGT